MPVIRYNNTTNYNASDIARRAQGRAVFANALVQQKTLDLNCQNRVVAGPAAATSYSGSKYIDQRVGTVFTTPEQAATILASSPCVIKEPPPPVPESYPNYELSCSDPAGIQIMATGPFTRFTFTTTSLGAGVIEFQFFILPNTYISSQLVVLGQDSNLITPPPLTEEVRYVFKCNPIPVEITCGILEPQVLQETNPYTFDNTSGSEVVLQLYLYPFGEGGSFEQIVAAGQSFTPTPSWGYARWTTATCV